MGLVNEIYFKSKRRIRGALFSKLNFINCKGLKLEGWVKVSRLNKNIKLNIGNKVLLYDKVSFFRCRWSNYRYW